MLRSLLRQKGYTFTDLTPNPNVVALNSRLGFASLDTTTALVLNMPWPVRSRGVRVVDNPSEIDGVLSGRDQKIYRDHAATAVHNAVLTKGDRSCYVMFRRERRQGVCPILLRSCMSAIPTCSGLRAAFLPISTGAARNGCDAGRGQGIGHRPTRSIPVAGPPKMYLSEDLQPDQIDYLYSELTCCRPMIERNIGNVRRKGLKRGMRTNLHHLIEDRAAIPPAGAGVDVQQDDTELRRAMDQVRGVAAGLGELGVAARRAGRGLPRQADRDGRSDLRGVCSRRRLRPINPLLRPARSPTSCGDCDVRVLVTSPERLALLGDEL